MAKLKRQPGSFKMWIDETTGLFWASTIIHQGRASRQVNGPLCTSKEEARDSLSRYLSGN